MSSTDPLKKPQTSYFLWFAANREKIQNMLGTKNLPEVGKKGAELWKKASPAEKGPFEKEAQKQKAAYDAYVATPEGQKALEAKKTEKKEEKQAKQEKEDQREKMKEEKRIAKQKRECKAAVKAVEKDEKLKKPMSAYFMWLNDNRAKITSIVGKGGKEVATKAAEMWKNLGDRDKKAYEERAKREKEEYEAYIATPEGAAALKAYKDATAAASYKEPPKAEEPAEEESKSPKKLGQKRKADAAETGAEQVVKKTKSAKAGA